MRTFIAIALNDDIHNELALLQSRLRSSGADVKWVQPQNIHLTLKFLGEIDDRQAGQVKSSLDEIARRSKPFYIHLGGIGTFPKPSFPRVVWAGIDEGANECKNLAESVQSSMEQLGFEKEDRPFTAHLTLGRVRSPKNRSQLISAIEKEKGFLSKYKAPVEKITLFQSTLTPQGSIYTPIKEFPLP